MPSIRILDSLSDPGDPDRANEDAVGGNRFSAFVIDGATGLGGKPLLDAPTDAAWLAGFAKTTFENEVGTSNPMDKVVRELNDRAAQAIAEAAAGAAVEPWRLPTAGFQIVRIEDGALAAYGLGDCRLFVVDRDGRWFETSGLAGSAERERESVRLAIAHAGGLAAWRSLADEPAIREELRRGRSRHNKPGGAVWTLGTAPEAGAHLTRKVLAQPLPATGLLCTDGFSALVDNYARYSASALVDAARQDGLAALLDVLRRIEREEDPDGLAFPRFKVSDDATALLFEVA